jgi:hypothetical protein
MTGWRDGSNICCFVSGCCGCSVTITKAQGVWGVVVGGTGPRQLGRAIQIDTLWFVRQEDYVEALQQV